MNPALPSTAAELLSEVTMEIALNLASVTCLKPFLRPFQDAGYILSTSLDGPPKYGITGPSRLRSETYLMLGTIGSTVTRNKDGSIVRTRVEQEIEDVGQLQSMPRAKLRADAGHHEAACEHDGQGYGDVTSKGIQVSTTVEVQRNHDL